MGNKKIVYLPSDDDDDGECPTGQSILSGHVMNNVNNVLEKCNKKLSHRLKTSNRHLNRSKNQNKSGEFAKNAKLKPKIKQNSSTAPSNNLEDVIFLSEEVGQVVQSNKRKHEKIDLEDVITISDDEDDSSFVIPPAPTLPRPRVQASTIEDIIGNTEEIYQQLLAEKEAQPISIKMKRLDRIEHFSILPNQSLSTILDDVGKKFNIAVPNIILYLNDDLVDPKSTPRSLHLSIADIIEVLARSNKTCVSDVSDPNFITLHLRDNSKKRLTIRINRFQTVEDLAQYYAKEKKIDIFRLQLEFDCEKMSFDQKIDVFDMDNDDQIDVIIK